MSETKPPNKLAPTRTPSWVALVGASVGIAETAISPGTPAQRSAALSGLVQTATQ